MKKSQSVFVLANVGIMINAELFHSELASLLTPNGSIQWSTSALYLAVQLIAGIAFTPDAERSKFKDLFQL